MEILLQKIVAHKGIGKSAVFRMFYLENVKDNVLSIRVKPDDILGIANTEEETDPLEMIRQWKSGLEELLVEKVTSNFNISKNNDVVNQISGNGLKLTERISMIVKRYRMLLILKRSKRVLQINI